MFRHKFALLLPIIVVSMTVVLWFSARSEYLRHVCPPAGACPSDGWLRWSDFTPISIQIAGIISIPVAVLAVPLYSLVEETASKSQLFGWLAAVAVLWAFIGWRVDIRKAIPRLRTPLPQIVGTIGVLFAIFVFLATVAAFHVGLIYKTSGILWALLILGYSVLFFRRPQPSH